MNVQAAPSPYTPVGGSNMPSGNPPVLGSQMPGTTGGLPALGGLSAAQNPMATQLQSMGRDEDSMLVHMTPNEVNSLQGLAMAAGGSLTINPQTGLPEAGFLKKLLPTLLGAGLSFIPGVGPLMAAGIVGGGQTLLTGDLRKGLMAGLGAYGGASLAGGIEGAISGASKALAAPSTVLGPAGPMSTAAIPAGLPGATTGVVKTGLPGFMQGFGNAARGGMTGVAGKAAPMVAGMGLMSSVSDAFTPKMPTYSEEEGKFNYVPVRMGRREVRFQTPEQMRASGGAEFRYITPTNPEPEPIGGFAEGGPVNAPQQDFNSLVASYQAQNPGAVTASMYPPPSGMQPSTVPSAPAAGILPPRAGAGETMYGFNRPTQMPIGGATAPGGAREAFDRLGGFGGLMRLSQQRRARGANSPAAPTDSMSLLNESMRFGRFPTMGGYADGGAVDMGDGSFVVDARTVSELGNGSSNAGIEMLSRMGGRPVRGPGDGVSDSVKASIGGKQEARVARDEVIFSPDAVRRIGGGSEKRGTQKLYAMMNKAHKARKKAKRGQDTGLRRGLA